MFFKTQVRRLSGLLIPGIENILNQEHDKAKNLILKDSTESKFHEFIKERLLADDYSSIKTEVMKEYIKFLQQSLKSREDEIDSSHEGRN
jgi:hypothetical protein